MPPQAKVLLVDDKESVLELLATILESYELSRASDGAKALELVAAETFDVVVTDIRMPGADGHEVLRAVKSMHPDTEVVMMTAYATVADAVAAVKRGAYDYIEKPFDPDDLALVVARATDHRRQALAAARAGKAEESSPEGVEVSRPYRDALDAARDRVSREYLAALMREFNGCVTWAAERAGMDRVSLHRLLRRYGIRSEDFKRPEELKRSDRRTGRTAAEFAGPRSGPTGTETRATAKDARPPSGP